MKQYYIISVIIVLLSGVCMFPDLNAMDDAIWAQATQWPDDAPLYDYVAALNTDGPTKINAIKNPQNAKRLLLEAAKAQRSAASENIVDTLMKRIDALDPDKKLVVFNATNAQTLIDLINNYNTAFGQSALRRAALPGWVAWFIERGIPADSQTSAGLNAMRTAIGASRNDVVRVLLTHGAQTTTSFTTLMGNQHTPITYAKALKQREDIVATLENPPAVTWRPEINKTQAAWNRWADSKISDQDMLLPVQDRNHNPITTKQQYVTEVLEGESVTGFKDFIASADKAVLQKIKTDLEQNQNNVVHYTEKIKHIDSVINSKSFSFSDLKAGLSIIAAAITANAFYTWFTRKPAQHQQKNIIINKTAAPLFIDGQTIAANETFMLPQHGEIRIKLMQNQDQSKDLVINMDAYTDDLNDSYLNLIIYKKWFSRLFTVPLSKSEVWVDKKDLL